MSDEKRTYTWSHDGEHFECDDHASREDALEAGRAEYPHADCIWTGVSIPAAEICPEIDASDVIERLQEGAHEEVGAGCRSGSGRGVWQDCACRQRVARAGRHADPRAGHQRQCSSDCSARSRGREIGRAHV